MFFLILIQRLKKSIITTYKIIHKYIIISNDSKYNIDNNFQLDEKLRKFYDEFNFKKGPIISDFINNLNNI